MKLQYFLTKIIFKIYKAKYGKIFCTNIKLNIFIFYISLKCILKVLVKSGGKTEMKNKL